ncbi:LytTR family transcriptional regulator [Oscillospiraceae bacterium HV4-5-C5C]|nr:LytTR family transcriptional regulator [Oscillospiraceae bacterium HV4-5-C5C]
MNVDIRISPEVSEPYAVIYAAELTEEITSLASDLSSSGGKLLAVWENNSLQVLRPQDIFLIRSENGQTVVCCEQKQYCCPKKLYEAEAILSSGFMRISKSALINLQYLDAMELSFSGLMLLKLKNGSQEYISRKYLPRLKQYLGL